MGQKARANIAARNDASVTDRTITPYMGKHGHGLAAKTAARGGHNKARLERLNELFRKAELPVQSTLTRAEVQRKQLPKLLAAKKAAAKPVLPSDAELREEVTGGRDVGAAKYATKVADRRARRERRERENKKH